MDSVHYDQYEEDQEAPRSHPPVLSPNPVASPNPLLASSVYATPPRNAKRQQRATASFSFHHAPLPEAASDRRAYAPPSFSYHQPPPCPTSLDADTNEYEYEPAIQPRQPPLRNIPMMSFVPQTTANAHRATRIHTEPLLPAAKGKKKQPPNRLPQHQQPSESVVVPIHTTIPHHQLLPGPSQYVHTMPTSDVIKSVKRRLSAETALRLLWVFLLAILISIFHETGSVAQPLLMQLIFHSALAFGGGSTTGSPAIYVLLFFFDSFACAYMIYDAVRDLQGLSERIATTTTNDDNDLSEQDEFTTRFLVTAQTVYSTGFFLISFLSLAVFSSRIDALDLVIAYTHDVATHTESFAGQSFSQTRVDLLHSNMTSAPSSCCARVVSFIVYVFSSVLNVVASCLCCCFIKDKIT
jgi:hypothetical protein